jgi:hypothetical protein
MALDGEISRFLYCEVRIAWYTASLFSNKSKQLSTSFTKTKTVVTQGDRR